MSSDGYFEDDLDSVMLEQIDNIEAAHFSQYKDKQRSPSASAAVPAGKETKTAAQDSDGFDIPFDVDESDLQMLDNFIQEAYEGKAQPVARPSKLRPTASNGRVQMTLFGEVLQQPETDKSSKGSTSERTLSRSKSQRNAFGQQAQKTKVWDQTAFAKSGWNKPKSGKGKGKAAAYSDEEEEEEAVEFEQFPTPSVVPGEPPLPMKLRPDLLEAKHWIYPLNKPKRDYQFNIVQHSLFENTLVALPTGLGKTFIAGVVMLNFYRWFPTGKVIFVAPTKPLVAQQILACHKTCGIPGNEAVELTGNVTSTLRARYWQEKRLFYMTPQTLENDLRIGNCNPSDIILLVVDEAHKATGDYAYVKVVRYLMATNPHFRLLALTATPGNKPEAVQTIVDGLHISRIEIRDESSLDLKDYMHKKTVKEHVVKPNDDMLKSKDLFVELMESVAAPLKKRHILPEHTNMVTMHSYRPQAISQDITRNRARQGDKWAYGALRTLGDLCRALGYLLEGTQNQCYNYIKQLAREPEPEPGKKKFNQNVLRSNPKFQAVLSEMETQRARGFSCHPKMDLLKSILLQHFADSVAEDEEENDHIETRAIVYVNFREAVEEVVEELNREKPLIRASKFIGQGTDKSGNKGFAQKEQKQVVMQFTNGEFNVLVATAIGEEGLDIGEVDLIVCYDVPKSSVRMLQRVGRTGRKRSGFVHVLLAEDREEQNWAKAQSSYKEVQRSIVRGDDLELYGDVERLLPDGVKPECNERVMEIQEYVPEEPTGRRKKSSGSSPKVPGKKRKRNDDVARNIPPGASTGFVSVAQLLQKGSKKRKQAIKPFNPAAGEDDETDMELEAGPRRTVSSSAVPASEPARGKIRRAVTEGSKKRKPKPKKASGQSKGSTFLTASQLMAKGLDDSDDMEIEGANYLNQSVSPVSPGSPSGSTKSIHPRVSSSTTPEPLEVIDIASDSIRPSPPLDTNTASSMSRRSVSASPKALPSSPAVPPQSSSRKSRSSKDHGDRRISAVTSPTPSVRNGPSTEDNIAWLVDDDDDPDIEIVDSSPLLIRSTLPATNDGDKEIVDLTNTTTVLGTEKNGTSPRQENGDISIITIDDSISFVDEVPSAQKDQEISPTIPPVSTSTPHQRTSQRGRKLSVPPPELPSLLMGTTARSDDDAPEPTFPIRPAGKLVRRRVVIDDEDDEHADQLDLLNSPRGSAGEDLAPPRWVPRTREGSSNAKAATWKDNLWMDIEAVHSGDEVSEGSSHEELESESDRLFLHDHSETQVSPSYDQSGVYRRSLLTQAPASAAGPVFLNQPVRPRLFGRQPGAVRPIVSSSPPPEDCLPERYELGSFVVDDEAELVYEDHSEP